MEKINKEKFGGEGKKKERHALSPAPNIEEGLAEYMWITEDTPQSPMAPMRCVDIQYRNIESDGPSTLGRMSCYAVGGLSGGESKDDFWRTVNICTDLLPKHKPRYLMGVGFAADLVVCVALGIDMFDCVFPTCTGRFGCALVMSGQLNLKQKKYSLDMRPIDVECECSTCKTYTRFYLHHIVTVEPVVACSLLTVHNISCQLRLKRQMRSAIEKNEFPKFVQEFMIKHFGNDPIPKWITEAMAAVNIQLLEDKDLMNENDLTLRN
uniref:tRNA-guanine(15) transglycosylase-like domain-containing protein n=1 Tax=Glossina pallidipes TaxID=7398 RepID=A0A1A9ZHJ7_GLOPL